MRILFDANTPAPLARFFEGHDVVRAQQLGWQNLQDGALLEAADRERFDVLLTCDQNIEYQQNLKGRRLALVVVSTNHWPTLRPISSRIASAVSFVQVGQIIRVDVDSL